MSIYLDGEFKARAGDGEIKLIVKEGKHKIKVTGTTADGDWNYEGEEEIEIGGGVEQDVSIFPRETPTAKKQAEFDEYLREQDEIEKKQMAIAEKNGCEDYKVYEKVTLDKALEDTAYSKKTKSINENKEKYFGDKKFYFEKNDYVVVENVQTNKDKKELIVNIKNLDNEAAISYLSVSINVFDDNRNYIGSFSPDSLAEYDSNIQAGKTKEAKVSLSRIYDGK